MGSFVLFGLGIGIAYYPILKTCWKYFPEKKGLITGLVLCCFGLSPFAFTTLADLIINKEGTPADDKGIFPEKVAIKMKDYALIMAITQGIFGFIALLIMFPMDSVESTDKDDKKEEAQITTEGEETLVNKEETAEVEKPKEDSSDIINEKPLKQAALSFKFHMFNLMSVGTLFFGYFSTNTNRSFGSLNKIDETYLQTMSKVCSFLNGLFRIAWGFVFDCLGFKIPYLIVVVNQVVVSSTFYFSARNKYFYFAANLLENVTFSGHGTIAPPLVTQIFGMKNAIILLGITGYYIGSCGFVGALIAKFIIKKSEDYLIVYLIGAAFAVISLIITIFMNGDKFPYKEEHTRVTISAVEPEKLVNEEEAPRQEVTKDVV